MKATALRPSIWRPSRLRGRGARAAASRATEWGESTIEGQRWQRALRAGRRWAVAGALCGALFGLVAFAPAAWLARWVEHASGGHILLADAQGSIWTGSAVAVLAGGKDSREARSLPGRLHWRLRPAPPSRGFALSLRLSQACCLNDATLITLKPGWGTFTTTLQPTQGWIGQWPAAWLSGLGTPWNTLQPGGNLRLTSTSGLSVQWVQGRWRVQGSAALEIIDAASRITTLDRLGSYRLQINGDPTDAGAALFTLSTTDGALQLSGQGTLGANGLRFRGEARAATEADRPALDNMLNIIGRRDGARSVIAIG